MCIRDSNMGMYEFTDLPLGETYTVTVNTDTVLDKDDGVTGDSTLMADETSEGVTELVTTLTDDVLEDDPTLDFGFTELGSIGSTVFHDANNDGIYDEADGDFPLEAVEVILTYPDGTTETATTNNMGMYEFTDLPLGETYTVTVNTDTVLDKEDGVTGCLLYTSPSPRDATLSRMPSSA